MHLRTLLKGYDTDQTSELELFQFSFQSWLSPAFNDHGDVLDDIV